MTDAQMDQQKDFESFMKETRTKAGEAYVNGDSALIFSLTTRQAGSTFFGPAGGYVSGVEEVLAANENGAKAFEPGGSNELESSKCTRAAASPTGSAFNTREFRGSARRPP